MARGRDTVLAPKAQANSIKSYLFIIKINNTMYSFELGGFILSAKENTEPAKFMAAADKSRELHKECDDISAEMEANQAAFMAAHKEILARLRAAQQRAWDFLESRKGGANEQ